MIRLSHPAVFNLGFRPFFLGASGFAMLSVLLWLLVFTNQIALPMRGISSLQWHAHEMIYGYTMAVIAGFLLTAVRNWTGRETPQGWPLAVLLLLWAGARLCGLLGTALLPVMAVVDMAFCLLLLVSVSRPVVLARKWKQVGILAKILLLTAGNGLFYLGALNDQPALVPVSIYGGLYLIIALILTIGRRVIPFFVRSALDVELPNSRLLDAASLLSVLVFFVAELVSPASISGQAAAAVVFLVNALRLVNWQHPAIWTRPLLWSLYLAFWFITFGFLLFALSGVFGLSRLLAVHALAFGGIGVITVGMMGRVAIGHTGRNLAHPPRLYAIALGCLLVATLVRVGLPLLLPQYYITWIVLSGSFWIAGFLAFLVAYAPILVSPRIDGRYG